MRQRAPAAAPEWRGAAIVDIIDDVRWRSLRMLRRSSGVVVFNKVEELRRAACGSWRRAAPCRPTLRSDAFCSDFFFQGFLHGSDAQTRQASGTCVSSAFDILRGSPNFTGVTTPCSCPTPSPLTTALTHSRIIRHVCKPGRMAIEEARVETARHPRSSHCTSCLHLGACYNTCSDNSGMIRQEGLESTWCTMYCRSRTGGDIRGTPLRLARIRRLCRISEQEAAGLRPQGEESP